MLEGVDPKLLEDFILDGLHEDIQDGDHTSLACIPEDSTSKAKLLVKDTGVLAGVDLARRIFKHLDPEAQFEMMIEDGSDVKFGDEAFHVTCKSRALLMGERLVLNAMQRMSGIATMSSRFMMEVEGTDVTILDTRKTTPLLRFIEKWAVRIGGCTNYRDGLYDWIMIKDNHIDAAGSITDAITRVHKYLRETQKGLNITIEVRNLVELHEVLAIGGVTRIMLDNFELPILAEAIQTIGDKFESEASGGINLHTVRKIANTGVGFISVGALTHSAGSLDLSLKVVKE